MSDEEESILIAVQVALTRLVETAERLQHTVGSARERIEESVSKIAIALTGEPRVDRRAPGRSREQQLHSVPLEILESDLDEVFGTWVSVNNESFTNRYGSDWFAKLEVSAHRTYGAQWKRMILKIAADRRKK